MSTREKKLQKLYESLYAEVKLLVFDRPVNFTEATTNAAFMRDKIIRETRKIVPDFMPLVQSPP